MKRLLKYLVILAVLPAFFAWGVFVHRDHVFPYDLLKGMGVRISHPKKREWKSRSQSTGLVQGLPYLDGQFDPNSDQSGVLLHDPDAACEGLNFYNNREWAYLIDMDGELVKEWHYPSGDWYHAELLPDGGVLALMWDSRLIRLDADSDKVWELRGRYHHGVSIGKDGNIYALTREPRSVPEIHPDAAILTDLVQVVSMDGEVIETFDLLDLMLHSPYRFLLPSVQDRKFKGGDDVEIDVLHANHVEAFDGSLADRSPLYAAGNLIVSMRNINTIAVIDREKGEIAWAWGPTNISFQHQPAILENGNILVFNNGQKASEVVELDPIEQRVVWRYAPGKEFFSMVRGSVQRLPNGNTLITESDKGYVLEVTPEKKVVWRFGNPDVSEDGIRRFIWRMTRHLPEELPWLD